MSQGNTTVRVSTAEVHPKHTESASSSASDPSNHDQTAISSLPHIVRREWCGLFAISSDTFTTAHVGAKSLNTQKLKVSATLCTQHYLVILLHKFVRSDKERWLKVPLDHG